MNTDVFIQYMSHEDIHKLIEKYLPVRVDLKNKYGEVFTPIVLIEEMLDKLPKEVWSNPDLKWLDPANGIGNFPMIAYKHLMKGLEEWEPDKDIRSNHIIKNMLYMIELNPKNVGVSRKIFGKDANIYCGTFLEQEWQEGFPKQFDIIMGNPPYNNSNHMKFINISLNLLNNEGLLLFITPKSWLSPTSVFYTKLQLYNILLINSSPRLKDYFPKIGSNFSYFIIENSKTKTKTQIYNDEKDIFFINFHDIVYPPTIINKITLSINHKILDIKNNNKFIRKDKKDYSSSMVGEYIYPYISFVKKDGSIDIHYRKIQDEYQNKPKILLFRNGYINPYYDDGLNGVGDNIHFKILENTKEGKLYEDFFKSNLISYIFKINKYSQYNNGYLMNIINTDIIKYSIKKTLTDEDIYDYYGITQKERELIESINILKRIFGKHLSKPNINEL